MTIRSRTAALATLAGLALTFAPGCGGLPLLPATPTEDDGFREVGAVTPSGVDQDAPQAMALFAGDVVTLRMMSAETTEVAGLSVDARGMLHVPLAGDVEVQGLPLVEAEERIERALQRYDRTVRVTVILAEPRGHQATVIGAVGDQGRVVVVPGMRVADLLAAAGGLSSLDDGGTSLPTADLYAARLMRDGQAVPVSIALAVQGDPRHNVYVRPGDHLYVPPQLGSLISVLGEVGAARVFAHRPGIRLSQALALAGGITRDANGGDIRIVRGPLSTPRVYRAGIDHIVSGHYADPVLAPGDIVYVGSSALADFRDVMAAIAPVVSILATSGTAIAISAGTSP